MRWYPPLLLLLLLSFLLAPSSRAAQLRFILLPMVLNASLGETKPPPLDHGVSNGLWRHWTFRDVTPLVLNSLLGIIAPFRYVSSTKLWEACSTLVPTRHTRWYISYIETKRSNLDEIDRSCWNECTRTGEHPLTKALILQDESVVTETIKPKIDALLRGHGSVIMGSLWRIQRDGGTFERNILLLFLDF